MATFRVHFPNTALPQDIASTSDPQGLAANAESTESQSRTNETEDSTTSKSKPTTKGRGKAKNSVSSVAATSPSKVKRKPVAKGKGKEKEIAPINGEEVDLLEASTSKGKRSKANTVVKAAIPASKIAPASNRAIIRTRVPGKTVSRRVRIPLERTAASKKASVQVRSPAKNRQPSRPRPAYVVPAEETEAESEEEEVEEYEEEEQTMPMSADEVPAGKIAPASKRKRVTTKGGKRETSGEHKVAEQGDGGRRKRQRVATTSTTVQAKRPTVGRRGNGLSRDSSDGVADASAEAGVTVTAAGDRVGDMDLDISTLR